MAEEGSGADLRPTPEVLLELGELVWDALHLEQAVLLIVGLGLGVRVGERAPVGEWIRRGLLDLDDWPDSPERDALRCWLVEARDALEDRNRVLHSMIGVRAVEAPTPEDLSLFHRRSMTPTALSVAGLRPVRERLDKAWWTPEGEPITWSISVALVRHQWSS